MARSMLVCHRRVVTALVLRSPNVYGTHDFGDPSCRENGCDKGEIMVI